MGWFLRRQEGEPLLVRNLRELLTTITPHKPAGGLA